MFHDELSTYKYLMVRRLKAGRGRKHVGGEAADDGASIGGSCAENRANGVEPDTD